MDYFAYDDSSDFSDSCNTSDSSIDPQCFDADPEEIIDEFGGNDPPAGIYRWCLLLVVKLITYKLFLEYHCPVLKPIFYLLGIIMCPFLYLAFLAGSLVIEFRQLLSAN